MGDGAAKQVREELERQAQIRDMLRRPTEQVSGKSNLSRFQVLRFL